MLFRTWWRAVPFTVGMALTLIALCFLVRFCDRGLDFAEEEIWLFAIFFLAGFPVVIFGINRMAKDSDL